jgi:hypothetical protein
VRELRDQGQSLRSIAAEVGISHEQVRVDLQPVNLPAPEAPVRRPPVFERTKIERGRRLFTDEHGNLFDDEQLRHPIGRVVGRVVRAR